MKMSLIYRHKTYVHNVHKHHDDILLNGRNGMVVVVVVTKSLKWTQNNRGKISFTLIKMDWNSIYRNDYDYYYQVNETDSKFET